jgi:hypothetical protein
MVELLLFVGALSALCCVGSVFVSRESGNEEASRVVVGGRDGRSNDDSGRFVA